MFSNSQQKTIFLSGLLLFYSGCCLQAAAVCISYFDTETPTSQVENLVFWLHLLLWTKLFRPTNADASFIKQVRWFSVLLPTNRQPCELDLQRQLQFCLNFPFWVPDLGMDVEVKGGWYSDLFSKKSALALRGVKVENRTNRSKLETQRGHVSLSRWQKIQQDIHSSRVFNVLADQ